MDALSATAVPRLVEPAVAEVLRRGAASRVLLQKRLEKEQSDERAEAKKRFDEAEARVGRAVSFDKRSKLYQRNSLPRNATSMNCVHRSVLSMTRSLIAAHGQGFRGRRRADAGVLEETQKKLASTTDDLANAESRAGDAEASLEATRRELRSEREMSATLTQSLEQLQNRVADLDGRLKRSEDDASAAALRHGDAIEQREKELSELRRRLNESEADAAKLADDLDELTRSNAQAQANADARNLS